mgnify:CR=1 FL=1
MFGFGKKKKEEKIVDNDEPRVPKGMKETAHKLHSMDGESSGEDTESHCVVDQHEGYEQQKRYEHAQHHRYPAEVRIERIHKRPLIHHLIHKRALRNLGSDDLQAV